MKKNCVELSQNLSKINFDKNDTADIQKELEYKNDIIKYLEGLLKEMNINPELLSEEAYKKKLIKKNNSIQNNQINNNRNSNPNIKNENYFTYKNNNNILDKYFDKDNSLENCININVNNSKDFKKASKTYSNMPINISEIINRNSANSNMIKYNKIKNSENNINNDNNKNNNENNTNEDNNYNIFENDNLSKNYFSFYNWGQNYNNNSNLVEYKKKYSSNFNSPQVIKKEIDDIDKEIIELQTRLKQLLEES